jgi:Putative Ig domain
VADIVIDSIVLPDGVVGVPYEAAIAYHGNATALSASSITSGQLPPHLALDSALPFARVRGTPKSSDVGTWTFKVTLTDTAGAVQSGNYTITIRTSTSTESMNSGQESLTTRLARQWPTQY